MAFLIVALGTGTPEISMARTLMAKRLVAGFLLTPQPARDQKLAKKVCTANCLFNSVH